MHVGTGLLNTWAERLIKPTATSQKYRLQLFCATKRPSRHRSSGNRVTCSGVSRRVSTSRPEDHEAASSQPATSAFEGSWRLFGVKVAASADPGKDDFEVHAALMAAIMKRLGIRDAGKIQSLPARIVRKSFDARPKQPTKFWVYVVDISAAALQGTGARLREVPGQLEKLAAPDGGQGAPVPSLLPSEPSSEAAHKNPGQGAHSDVHSIEAEPSPQHGGHARPGPAAPLDQPVVVVGSGPAGLFSALALAEAGIKVLLLERGQPVEVRGGDIGALFARRKLNPRSNLCYGEGGAGTWSDGKLTTRIGRNSDPVRAVLSTLHEFGAPESVLVSGKPHLGTDRLVRILKAFRQHLTSLGTEVRFGARVDDLVIRGGKVAGVRLDDGSEVRASRVVLAMGHSARDMYRRLVQHDVLITPKPFAMGFRIEHPQALVNRLQYGEDDASEVLRGRGRYPVADYRLAAEVALTQLPPSQAASVWYTPDAWYTSLASPLPTGAAPPSGQLSAGVAAGAAAKAGHPPHPPQPEPQERRGVYSFCMCPGGQIVPTSTRPEELCINGMSFSRRNSQWANSALVATVPPSDWAHLEAVQGPLAGVALQEMVEREAARRGGGDFVCPVQRVDDFLEGRASAVDTLPSSSYRLGVRSAPLHDLYPPHLTEAFRAALLRFDRAMPGFAGREGLLHAAETRTSAPLRIERGEEDLQSPGVRGLYPCGEGAGYAGGIVSAAVDGLRVGSVIAAELLGGSAPHPAASYKVKAGY